MPDATFGILVILLLLVCSGFLALSEIAVVSAARGCYMRASVRTIRNRTSHGGTTQWRGW
jgi:CBS domain containing-hemolysin-like protein